MDRLRYMGSKVLDRVEVIGGAWKVVVYSVGSFLFRFRKGRRAVRDVLLKQIYFTGFETLSLIAIVALILGFVVVTQSFNILPKLGEERFVGEIMVWVVVRELGPIFAAILVIARSGAAIASEIGAMKISREILSLEAMGIDPMRYLVMPRVIGTAVSVFVLTFYFVAVSVLGGYMLAGFGRRISLSVYLSSVMEAMGPVELLLTPVKGILFGLIIGSFCAYHGLRVGKSITEIPQETSRAVIGSLQMLFITDALFAVVFYM